MQYFELVRFFTIKIDNGMMYAAAVVATIACESKLSQRERSRRRFWVKRLT